MIRKTLTILAVVISSSSFAEEPFAFKGYAIDQAMVSCPRGTIRQEMGSFQKICVLGKTTYAGVENTDMTIFIYEGKILSVMLQLDLGFLGRSTVLEAMTAKFGRPISAPSSYEWARGTQRMNYFPEFGTILATDTKKEAERESRVARARIRDM